MSESNSTGHKALLATLVLTLCAAGCGGSGGSGTTEAPPSPPSPPPPPPPPVTADWDLAIDTTNGGEPLTPALVGYYDLSGALFDYTNVPGLVALMNDAGFSSGAAGGADWRVGLGRWEIATHLFPTLSDGSACGGATPQQQTPYASDADLLAARDWFTYTDGSPVTAADIDDSRYSLSYLRSVLDVAEAFGATPFVSIDLMPRALSVDQSPERLDCNASFANSVSNNEPADDAVFARAVAGLVERVVEGTGTGDERPRDVSYWEIWNEPELATFWEPTLAADPNSYFDMAVAALRELDAYRNSTGDPDGQSIRIGLGSFLDAGTAVTTIRNFDAVNIPLDFVSFHSYHDDPLVIVDDIAQTAAAIENSANYRDVEIVLAEWGAELATRTGDQQYAAGMDPVLHAATVIALGASIGLDRAHNTFFYDFYPVIAIGLVDNAGNPRRLYRAYELMAKLVPGTTQRIPVDGFDDGRLDAGLGAVLAAQDPQSGTVRTLLVNRNSDARTVRITVNGSAAIPAELYVFDASTDPRDDLVPVDMPGDLIELPPRSVAFAEF